MSRPQDLIWQGASLFKRPPDFAPQAPAEKVESLADQMRGLRDLAMKPAHAMRELLVGHPEKVTSSEPNQLGLVHGPSLVYPDWVQGGADLAMALPVFGTVARGGLELSGGIVRGMKPFFSQLYRTIAERVPERATAEQILNVARKGSKAEELAYSGLENFLKPGQKYMKTDVLRHLEANAPELHERMISQPSKVLSPYNNEDIQAVMANPSIQPKFTQYTLPGGENHRELVVTLPVKEDLTKIPTYKEYARHFPVAPTNQEYERYVEAARNNNYGEGYSVPGGHAYGDPELDVNRLFHIRMNDRDKGKTLFMEELQSDWHQAGRKEGYGLKKLTPAQKYKAAEAFADSIDNVEWRQRFGEEAPEIFMDSVRYAAQHVPEDELRTFLYDQDTGNFGNSVPDAPFKTTWQELGMKRMLQEAAAGGYDRLAWTTGAQQADRYSLAKHFSKLEYEPDAGILRGYNRTGERTLAHRIVPDKLADYVGDDIAKKLLVEPPSPNKSLNLVDYGDGWFFDDPETGRVYGKSTGNGRDGWPTREAAEADRTNIKVDYDGMTTVEGDDLMIGGEGMRGFYDNILPKYMDRYGKKFGARVEKHQMPVGHEEKYFGIHDDFHEPLDGHGDLDGYVDDYRVNQLELTKEWVSEMSPEELKDYFAKNSTEHEREALEAYFKTDHGRRDQIGILQSWAIGKAQDVVHRIPRKDIIKQLVKDGTLEAKQAKDTVWSIKITPEMRQAILRDGQPLFVAMAPIALANRQKKSETPAMLPAHQTTRSRRP